MPKKKEKEVTEELVIPTELLEKDPVELASDEDYIFFSDPDEIPNPHVLENLNLKKKYGIFMQKCFNYKFNLFNQFESPWEGSRVCKKKKLKNPFKYFNIYSLK